MKKVLIFVVVLMFAVALIGPKIVGSQLQGGIQNTVDVINKNPNYTASITRLESTWFTTTAEVSLGLNLPDMPELTGQVPVDVSVDVNLTSHHGPILSSDGFAIGWLHTVIQTKSSEAPEGFVLPSDKPFYQFNGLTGLFGTTTYQDEVAAISYTDSGTGGTVVFSGLQGDGEISGSGITYQALADNVNMAIENAVNFDIQGLAIDFKSSESIAGMLSKGLYDSNSSFSMNLITFNDLMQDIEVRVVDTKLVALSDYDKASDLGNVKAMVTATSLNTTDISLTDLNTVIEFNNLQAKFLLAYQDFSSKMMDNMGSPSMLENDLQAFVQEHLLAQLQANPEYNISKLSGKINGSGFEGKTMTKLSGVTTIPDPLDDSAFWMQHIVVDSTMMMQKGAAEFVAAQIISYQLSANTEFMELGEEERAQIIQQQVPNMLVGLTQQGMITAEGEEYIATFTMEAGVVLLNGNPIPL
jgi:uncharacterized protein YdgA (DUF945 family)